MLRILQCTGALNLGGAETMVMNVYREIDRECIQFDFVLSGEEKGYYEEEAKQLGARIYHITKRSQSFWKNLKDLYAVIKDNQYKIIHFHTQNAFFTAVQIVFARIAGADKIVVHSHNTMDWRTGMALRLHYLFRPVLNRLTTVKLSCGEAAAEWLYGTAKDVQIVPLPVVCEKYRYREADYQRMRKQSGMEGMTLYAHVGRFSEQKNHTFLIDVFAEICKKEPNSRLLLIGDGELKEDIKAKAERMGLNGKVLFLGNRSDVNQKLVMADVFLFPSRYEGFPTVVLEAQAAGLPCYISDSITDRIAVTDLVHQISLKRSPEQWCEEILRGTKKTCFIDRNAANCIISKKYDIKLVTAIFHDIYKQLEL